MALDNTDGFTLGGLDNAPGGNAARIAVLQFNLEFQAQTDVGYTVDADGTVSTAVGTGAATADLTVTQGGGFTLKQTAGSATADIHATYILSFGDIGTTFATMGADANQNITVIGGTVNCGADLGGGSAVDAACATAVHSISGNSLTFSVGHPAVVPDGSAGLGDFAGGTTSLFFNVIAFIQPTN